MNGVPTTGKPGIIFLLFLFTLSWAGTPGAHAALLDGLLDEVEESLAEGLVKKGENLTTGNFYTNDKPNAHAPIGMMGDHTHEAGEVMFSYRLMHMFMEGNRYGTDRITNEAVITPGAVPSGYLVAPESMRMWMHMFGFMYGWNDTVTLTLMVPYLHNSMNHVTRMGEKFTTRSEGFGDIRFGSLWRLWAVEAPSIGAHRFHFNMSVSVPTGDIEPTDRTPMGAKTRLPYPMHPGSGTVDFYPGLTYGGEKGRASWGLQAIGTLRAGRNSHEFSKGDAYVINVHGAYEVIPDTLSGSMRLSWNHWDSYDGMDPAIRTRNPELMNQRIVQTAFPDLLGGQRLDVLFGLNVLFPDFMGLENRLAVEGGFPIYQYLDGQLETDSIVTFGWQAVY